MIFMFFLISGCSAEKERIHKKSAIAMDTVVTLSVVSESSGKAGKAMEAAFKELKKLEFYFDPNLADSDVSKINSGAGLAPVKVSPETIDVISKAVYVSEKTDGAFDITIGAVSRLWDFHKKTKPDEKTAKKAVQFVNYKNIIINKKKQTVFLRKKGMAIDVGGIAKGYAADKAVEALKQEGVKSGLVAIAGDIKAFGLKPDLKLWKVGIQNPRQKGRDDEIIAAADLADSAISTSGDYQRYFIEEGRRYHHVLDPGTGYPADYCISVSIFAQEGAMADAFSTGVFAMGNEKGIKLLDSLGFDAVIVDKKGKMIMTPRLKGRIEIIEYKKNS